MSVEIVPYAPQHLPALVAWWNRTFFDRRNFFPVSEEILRRRVMLKRNAIERFEPRHLLLAREEARVVGMAHVGFRTEEVCRIIYPGWKGGGQAWLAFLGVGRDARRQGIGSRLLAAAKETVARDGPLTLDGQCLNPYYGNSEGPFTPFFGTTEGVSVPWDDEETRRFFEMRGHAPRYHAVTMEAELSPAAPAETLLDEARSRGYAVQVVANRIPPPGGLVQHSRPVLIEQPFESAVALREGIVCALAVGYPMRELTPRRYAVYEVTVAEGLRGQGLGTAVLAALLRDAAAKGERIAEALTVPELSPGAKEMYARVGFREVTSWAVY